MSKLTTQKLVFAGDTVYLYHFERPICYGPREEKERNEKMKKKLEVKCDKATKEDNRKRALWRARSKMILAIKSNFGKWEEDAKEYFNPVFLTLTFEKNITDVKKANYEFTKFIQRLNNHIIGEKGSYLKYVNAIEFQKRGAIHYHCILFNMPFIKHEFLQNIWGNGFVFIKKVDNTDGIAFYISKYISKAFNDKRLYGQKCYFISKDLKKHLAIMDIRDINFFLSFLPLDKKRRMTTYKADFLGDVDVFEFNLTDGDYSYKYMQKIFATKYGSGVK